MHGSRKFFQRATSFFLVDEGGEDKKTLKAGHHWPASKTPFKWRFAGGPMMAQHWMLTWLLALWFFMGSGPVISEKPYSFVIFQRGSVPPVPPSGSAHARSENSISHVDFLWMTFVVKRDSAKIFRPWLYIVTELYDDWAFLKWNRSCWILG